jgi:GntR family galactonate operon transcriptional repressor
MFETLSSETLSSRVSRELIRTIVSGQFAPDEMLPTEEQLCSDFGVRRSVVREAMKNVAGIGLTRTRQGQGTVVLPPEHWNNFSGELIRARRDTGTMHEVLAEVMELRSIVEVRAAGLAAERANDDNLDVLTGLIEKMTGAIGDSSTFVRLDIEFHDEIFRATANHLIGSLFDILRPVLEISHEIGVSSQPQPGGMASAIAEHTRIVQAIRAGDTHSAQQAMLDHLDWSAGRETRQSRRG